MKNKIAFFNTLSKTVFLVLTPVFFRLFGFAFIWHSIYWGIITIVVLIWAFFIVMSPLLGRIGCGWFCFMGTLQDGLFGDSLIKMKMRKPLRWPHLIMLTGFLASALTFFFIRLRNGSIPGIRFQPGFLSAELNTHYRLIWMYDALGGILLGLLLDKRWACRKLCFMGSLCAAGAKHARLLPVLDPAKCSDCKKCESACLAAIPLTDYAKANGGLVTSAECLLCGRCVRACAPKALSIKFVWNRRKFLAGRES